MRRLLVLLLLGLPALPVSAQSVYLWELCPGLGTEPDAQYVVLNLFGVSSLDDYSLRVQDDAGAALGTFVQLAGAPPDTDGWFYTATPAAERAWGARTHLAPTAVRLPVESGRLCLWYREAPIDCVAYGQFTGDNQGWGTPTDGVGIDQALTRIGTNGFNQADWQRRVPPDPLTYVSPADGGLPAADGGSPDAGGAGGDGGSADAGADDGGGSGTPGVGNYGGGGSSRPYEPDTGCSRAPDRGVGCGGRSPDREGGCGGERAAMLLVVLLPWALRRRRPPR